MLPEFEINTKVQILENRIRRTGKICGAYGTHASILFDDGVQPTVGSGYKWVMIHSNEGA